jgi:dolichyl-phosphate beta-glucosyltransferase
LSGVAGLEAVPVRPAPPAAASRSYSIVIPAYNEEKRIPQTLQAIDAFLRRRGDDVEVLVVDDGSRDGTSDRVRELMPGMPSLRLLRTDPNHGKGYAVRRGILAATREAILFSDADLSTPIEEIDRLWEPYGRGADVVVASRHLAQSNILLRQPPHRRVISRVFNMIVSIFGVRGVRDTQCGFKLFRAATMLRIFAALKTDGFAFDVEVLMRARESGLRIVEVPVTWVDSPESKVRPIVDSSCMLVEILKMRGLW